MCGRHCFPPLHPHFMNSVLFLILASALQGSTCDSARIPGAETSNYTSCPAGYFCPVPSAGARLCARGAYCPAGTYKPAVCACPCPGPAVQEPHNWRLLWVVWHLVDHTHPSQGHRIAPGPPEWALGTPAFGGVCIAVRLHVVPRCLIVAPGSDEGRNSGERRSRDRG